MSGRYMNDQACGIEPEREGDEPTLEQWRNKLAKRYRVTPGAMAKRIRSIAQDSGS